MQAWIVERITEQGAMRLAEMPQPEPGTGEVLVRVEAAGLNFLDTLMLRGAYQIKPPLPFTPGVEVAGAVVAAGAGTDLSPGERVFAVVPHGGFAEQALVPQRAAMPIPDDLPSPEAVALLGISYPTAHYALTHRARLREGETVLVHAAAGSVGSAAVQLGLAAGARVVATARGAEKLAICRDLGAELAIDYSDTDWVAKLRAYWPEGADVILDPVGEAVGEQSLRCLAWEGRYLVIGFAGGRIPALPANRLLLKNAAAIGVFWGEVRNRDPELAREVQFELMGMFREGRVAPLIRGRYPLAEAGAALAALAGRATVGKVVLVP
ncbi:MAG: NADPH:quinone oxidoreductase family protein [Acidisphaera sp.]|nr:NADPH:quinone oxidoreductase family protein [Acidisphaera sp.]